MNTRLALLLGLAVGCANAACPPDFIASTTIPGKCYYLTTTSNSFFYAINYCRNNLTHGADILSIANGFENSEVASLLWPWGISSAWVGNAFYDNKSHWIATAAGSSNYSNWGSYTPSGNAAVISSSGSWGATNVGQYFSSIICQIYPDDPTTFPPPQITCPDGWRPSISARGKCYRNIGPNDFFSATRKCLTTRIGDSHAELLTVTSQLEIMELSATQPGPPWASLTSWEADGRWHWIETLHPTDYFGPWGQPTNSYGEGTCACLDNFNLFGGPCWASVPTICQYFPDEPSAPTLPDLSCPQNGTASLTKPGTCYYALNQTQSFQRARRACRRLNTGFSHNDLFVPRTRAEYEEFEAIVYNQISYPLVWLGLTSSNGNWGWISGQPSNTSNIWCSGQPDNGVGVNDRCAFVNHSNYNNDFEFCWTAGDCTDLRGVICQSSNTGVL